MRKWMDGLTGLTIGFLLTNHAKSYPHYMAVVDIENNKRHTYKELNDRVNRLANSLIYMGIQHNDKIGILMRDRSEFVEIMYASNKIGAVWAPCNYRFTAEEFESQLEHSDAKILFFEEEFTELVEKIKGSLPKIDKLVMIGGEKCGRYQAYESLIGYSSGEEPKPKTEISNEDTVSLIYTSGTTGAPKGTIHTHNTFLGWAFVAAYETSLAREDRILNPYPMFHMGGSIISVVSLLAGATNYIFGKFDPIKFLRVIEEESITMAFCVPTLIHFVNNLAQEEKDKYKLNSLIRLWTSGAPFLTEIQNTFMKQWPHIKLHSVYSATEACFTNLRPNEQSLKTRCVGLPVFGMEVMLMDQKGEEVTTGKLGVVYSRGITLFDGYYKNPGDTAKAFRGDWFTCEDVGYQDKEGYLYLVDRAKDMIISGGENIATVEVENILLKHPAIFEVAVIGIPDEKWGEKVHAVVSLKPGQETSTEEIIDWCKDKMAGFKRPKSVTIIPELPKNPTGKILKRALRDEYWQGRKVRI
jgi:long-chain acyl-CoA synthetase